MAPRVADLIGPGRMLALDAGSDPLVLNFHPFASEVLAINPEPAMLQVAQANLIEREGAVAVQDIYPGVPVKD